MQVQKIQNQNSQVNFKAIKITKGAKKLIKPIFPAPDKLIKEALSSDAGKIIPGEKSILDVKYVPLSELVQELETKYGQDVIIGDLFNGYLKFTLKRISRKFKPHKDINCMGEIKELSGSKIAEKISKMYNAINTKNIIYHINLTI